MVEDFGTLFPETAARFIAVNGVREPTITMRPGEVQRWRILHAGWQDDIFMDLEGHTLSPIARDGIPLRRMDLGIPRKPDQPSDYPNAMLMAPGQRIDVLVQAGKPGTYAFRAVPYDQGYAAPTGPIAWLVVEGDPMTMNLPAELPPPREKIIRDEEITGTRVLKFSTMEPGDGGMAEVQVPDRWQDLRSRPGGSARSPRRRRGMDGRQRGANDDHVFHIHVNDMLLTKVNGEPLEDPIWMDTAIVPRNGSITFRSRFLDFTGKYMLHCHMMNHEELGMMQVVEVYAGD